MNEYKFHSGDVRCGCCQPDLIVIRHPTTGRMAATRDLRAMLGRAAVDRFLEEAA